MLPKIQNDGSISCSNSIYDTCMYQGLRKEMLKKTKSENGCTTPWVNNTKKICKESDNINTVCMVDKTRIKNQLHDCGMPCESLGISLGNISLRKKTFSKKKYELKIFFPPRILLTVEKNLYEFENLIAEIGGLLGLVRNIFWIIMLFLGLLSWIYFTSYCIHIKRAVGSRCTTWVLGRKIYSVQMRKLVDQ